MRYANRQGNVVQITVSGRAVRQRLLLLVVFTLGMTGGVGADVPADVVLLHGRIHTQDPHRSVAEGMALRGNTIVAVGTQRAIADLVGPRTRTIDLQGRTVLPGIIDAHTHPAESAPDLAKCSLD